MSPVTVHLSPVMCHMSPVTLHMSFQLKLKQKKLEKLNRKNQQSGGDSQWRVCYLRGLPRLVNW